MTVGFNNLNGYRWWMPLPDAPTVGMNLLSYAATPSAGSLAIDRPIAIDPHAPRMLDLEPTREVATPAIAARKLDL